MKARTAVAIGGVLCVLAAVGLGAEARERWALRSEKLADGVYAFLPEESFTPVVSGNSLAVIGDDGVLVVDSGSFPSLAERMVAEIREKTAQPVRYVVHTHWHPDHFVGDGEFRKAFPGVVVISTDFTRTEILEQAPKYVRGAVEKGPALIEQVEKRLAAGKRADGSALSDDDRKFLRKEVSDLRFALAEYSRANPGAPDLTFDRDVTIHLGKREVRVSFLGRGNTGGDAVIFVPDAKVIAAGDLVVYPTPYSYGSYPGEWIEVLKKLMATDAAAILPGHGPVFHDWEYVRTLVALLESLRTQVGAAVHEGLDLEATRKRVDLSDFRNRMCGTDPDKLRAFDVSFAQVAVPRAYQEAKGSFEPE